MGSVTDDAVRNREIRQTAAIEERSAVNRDNTVSEFQRLQGVAVFKRGMADFTGSRLENKGTKGCTVHKCAVLNGSTADCYIR